MARSASCLLSHEFSGIVAVDATVADTDSGDTSGAAAR